MLSPEDVIDEWSSIRPALNTKPADMRRNGVFKIEEYDPGTGEVEGDYYDLEEFYEVRFEGLILPVAGSYAFIFNHDVKGTTKKRTYQGSFIAEVNHILVVAGRWKHEDADGHKTDETKNKETNKDAQDEGVWVLTKP